jgi:plasmid stability protein
MSAMIQIRNVPDKMHRRLKARAATAGMSMSEYLPREIRKIIERPTREELLERVARYPELDLSPEPTDLVREGRLS